MTELLSYDLTNMLVRDAQGATCMGPDWEGLRDQCGGGPPREIRKGTNGVSTNGVTDNFIDFDRGTFWLLPLTYFPIPKSAGVYLFPQSVKTHFCRGPISADPICPQPRDGDRGAGVWGGRCRGKDAGDAKYVTTTLWKKKVGFWPTSSDRLGACTRRMYVSSYGPRVA